MILRGLAALLDVAAALRMFSKDRRGAMVVLVAAAAIPLVAFLGVAADAARGYMVKARLSQALDAAGLAGAQMAHDSEAMQADITSYFQANFPPEFMNATINGPNYELVNNNEVLKLQADATIETTFMKVLGFNTLKVSAETEVTRKMHQLDLVLAIDMSGSMDTVTNGERRIESARNAAIELVNILFGADAEKDLLKIGVVPWNGKVNVMNNGVPYDSDATNTEPIAIFPSPPTWANGDTPGIPQSEVYFANNSFVPLLSPPDENWKGCVYSRYHGDLGSEQQADTVYGSLASGGIEWRAWEPVGPEGEPVPGWGRCAIRTSWDECTPCLSHGITALNGTKQEVLDALEELNYPSGTTNITEGLSWAWRVLLPTSPFTQAMPDEDVEGERIQAIVLLTDGENHAGNGDGYKAVFGHGTGNPAGTAMDARLLALAQNIKDGGVIIYTIQFAHEGSGLQTLMQTVASSTTAPHYHYAPNGDALKTIFKLVANNLSELRLSK